MVPNGYLNGFLSLALHTLPESVPCRKPDFEVCPLCFSLSTQSPVSSSSLCNSCLSSSFPTAIKLAEALMTSCLLNVRPVLFLCWPVSLLFLTHCICYKAGLAHLLTAGVPSDGSTRRSVSSHWMLPVMWHLRFSRQLISLVDYKCFLS